MHLWFQKRSIFFFKIYKCENFGFDWGRMALVSGGGRSTLNPDAPLFVPAALRQVEDYSPEWWQLITTSTWYHDYWLSQHQDDEDRFYDNDEDGFDGSSNIADLLPDALDFDASEDFSGIEAQFEEFVTSYETELEPLSANGLAKDGEELVKNPNWDKSPKPSSSMEAAKYAEKPANYVNPKFSSSSRIQQPR